MRTFKKFPEGETCILCGMGGGGECILAGIDGTESDGIEKAIPIHVDCISLRYNREARVVYQGVSDDI